MKNKRRNYVYKNKKIRKINRKTQKDKVLITEKKHVKKINSK